MPRLVQLLIAGATATATTASAQLPSGRSVVLGVVTDAGGPLAGARIVRQGLVRDSVFSDSAGRFRLSGLALGRQVFVVRKVGYEAVEFEIEFSADTSVTVDVALESVVPVMDTITIRGDSALGPYSRKLISVGFQERRREAQRTATDATFLTPEDIARRKPNRLASLLEGQRSVHVQYLNAHGAIARRRDGRCAMSLWVDGQLLWPPPGERTASGGLSGIGAGLSGVSTPATSGGRGRLTDSGIEIVLVTEIAAVEIYPSPSGTPQQFQSLSGSCGAIIVWTRQ